MKKTVPLYNTDFNYQDEHEGGIIHSITLMRNLNKHKLKMIKMTKLKTAVT